MTRDLNREMMMTQTPRFHLAEEVGAAMRQRFDASIDAIIHSIGDWCQAGAGKLVDGAGACVAGAGNMMVGAKDSVSSGLSAMRPKSANAAAVGQEQELGQEVTSQAVGIEKDSYERGAPGIDAHEANHAPALGNMSEHNPMQAALDKGGFGSHDMAALASCSACQDYSANQELGMATTVVSQAHFQGQQQAGGIHA